MKSRAVTLNTIQFPVAESYSGFKPQMTTKDFHKLVSWKDQWSIDFSVVEISNLFLP